MSNRGDDLLPSEGLRPGPNALLQRPLENILLKEPDLGFGARVFLERRYNWGDFRNSILR
jgi:hypothetical protein